MSLMMELSIARTLSYRFLFQEGDMLWLVRSVIVVINSDGNLTDVINAISKMALKVHIREMSNIMLLLTVDDSSLVDVCIGMVKSLDCNSISDIESWELSSIQRSSLVWVTLEEVPLDLWHENFFTALCNDWGKLIKIDDTNIRRDCFKFARCQILISSLFDIPNLVVGSSMGVKFKIQVTVEKNEEAVTVVSKGVDVSPAPFFYVVQEDPLLSINELASVSEGGIDDAFTDDLLHAKDGFGSDEINDE
ncbi:hypothetical protein COLO4_08777 [Corchorus olitorius]|uniref:Uncharacterized protein n=1 Tax=Corchorus olitorius TaxID=93759 RepID=A0A1R3KEQ0_9ROSI|nr:hypothetical protein COLO4_08777 [Corchorus olitorius]